MYENAMNHLRMKTEEYDKASCKHFPLVWRRMGKAPPFLYEPGKKPFQIEATVQKRFSHDPDH